jgi:hypothetical protein
MAIVLAFSWSFPLFSYLRAFKDLHLIFFAFLIELYRYECVLLDSIEAGTV